MQMASDTHADDAESAVDETGGIEQTDQADLVELIELRNYKNDPETVQRILAKLQVLPS